ncbi:MAG: hypothetical protein J6I45_00630, partial [Clostridia bacterium]|nr:hypothetical protein [Clostridia bacterium]
MKRSISRITSLLLLAALLIPTVTACAGEDAKQSGSDTTAAVTTAAPEDTTPSLEDIYPLPTSNYDGKEFNILILRSGYAGQDYNDLYAEEDSGDAIDAALFKRNQKVEDLVSTKIVGRELPDTVTEISKLIRADDDTCEMIQDRAAFMMPQLASEGLLHDINNISQITLEAPWYNTRSNDSATIANELYMISGDATASDKIGIAAVMFNKKLAEDFQIPNPYE